MACSLRHLRCLLLVAAGLAGALPRAADAASAPVPPLDETARAIVRDGAFDGRDGPDPAEAELLANLRAWPAEPDERQVLVAPAWTEFLADPGAWRGQRVRFDGRIAQRADAVASNALELFVRDRDGTPVRVIVPIDPETAAALAEGTAVRVDGRFHKTVTLPARDGAERTYPSLVARVTLDGAATAATTPVLSPVVMGAVVLGLGGCFVILRRLARSTKQRPIAHGAWRATPPSDEVDDARGLPEDPADALRELRRRTESSASESPHAHP